MSIDLQQKTEDTMKKTNNYGKVNVVENDKYQYGVTDNDGNIIVPFGKYGWISGFDHGLARVKSIAGIAVIDLETGETQEAKWGIIDESGQEILPLIYDEIWNFLQKSRSNTKVIIDGEEKSFDLNSHQLSGPVYHHYRHSYDPLDDYGSHYGEFAGSYAQDVMGYSDDVINDAFEGDPDAYWNID